MQAKTGNLGVRDLDLVDTSPSLDFIDTNGHNMRMEMQSNRFSFRQSNEPNDLMVLTADGDNYLDLNGEVRANDIRLEDPNPTINFVDTNDNNMHIQVTDDELVLRDTTNSEDIITATADGTNYVRIHGQARADRYCDRDGNNCVDGGSLGGGGGAKPNISTYNQYFNQHDKDAHGLIRSISMGSASQWDVCFLTSNNATGDFASISSGDRYGGGCTIDYPGAGGSGWSLRSIITGDKGWRFCRAQCIKF
jgi:hypothetical protein